MSTPAQHSNSRCDVLPKTAVLVLSSILHNNLGPAASPYFDTQAHIPTGHKASI